MLKPLNHKQPEFYQPVPETPVYSRNRAEEYHGPSTDFYKFIVGQGTELSEQIEEDNTFPQTCGPRNPRIMQRYVLKNHRYSKEAVTVLQRWWEEFVAS